MCLEGRERGCERNGWCRLTDLQCRYEGLDGARHVGLAWLFDALRYDGDRGGTWRKTLICVSDVCGKAKSRVVTEKEVSCFHKGFT